MIVYVPQEVYDRLYTRLKDMPEKIPEALKGTINDTAKSAKKKMLEEVQKKYIVKDGGFNKSVKIESATLRNLQATIFSEGRPISLYKFKVKKNRGVTAAQAQVLTSGMLKELTLRGGDTNGKDLKAFVQKMKNGHYGVFQRLGKDERSRIRGQLDGERRKGENGNKDTINKLERRFRKRYIKQLYSLSAPQMAESKKVYPIVRDTIITELRISMEKHIASVMEEL